LQPGPTFSGEIEMSTFKAAVREPLKLEGLVDGRDIFFEMTLAGTAELEGKIGRSMKTYMDWVALSASELTEVLRAGLRHYQTDADKLVDDINRVMFPELQAILLEAIVAHAWPDTTRRMAEEMAKAKERLMKGLPLKNAPSGDAL
jgi:hypothetical protein